MQISFRALLVTWILSLAVAFGFNFATNPKDPLGAERGLSSVVGPRSEGEASRIGPAGFCRSANNYACEVRTYGPTETDSSVVSRECVRPRVRDHFEVANQLCLQVLRISSYSATIGDRSVAAVAPAPSSRSETRCTLAGIKGYRDLESESSDLGEAVDSLMGKCLALATESK